MDFPPAYMLDQSHNVTDPIESLMSSAMELQRRYAQAVIIDRARLEQAQAENDAEIEVAEKAVEVSKAELDQNEEIVAKNPRAVPLTELRKLRFALQKSHAQVKQATNEKKIAGLTANAKKAQYDAASIELDLRQARAPFKGQVVEIMKKPGDNILPKDGEVLFFPSFFNKADSDRLFKSLLDNIIWQQDQIKFYGKLIDLPRLTAWYGVNDKPYTYSGIPMNPHPWTIDLLEIKNKIDYLH